MVIRFSFEKLARAVLMLEMIEARGVAASLEYVCLCNVLHPEGAECPRCDGVKEHVVATTTAILPFAKDLVNAI